MGVGGGGFIQLHTVFIWQPEDIPSFFKAHKDKEQDGSSSNIAALIEKCLSLLNVKLFSYFKGSVFSLSLNPSL